MLVAAIAAVGCSKGEQGPRGEAGAQGVPGIQGAKGDTGPQGQAPLMLAWVDSTGSHVVSRDAQAVGGKVNHVDPQSGLIRPIDVETGQVALTSYEVGYTDDACRGPGYLLAPLPPPRVVFAMYGSTEPGFRRDTGQPEVKHIISKYDGSGYGCVYAEGDRVVLSQDLYVAAVPDAGAVGFVGPLHQELR